MCRSNNICPFISNNICHNVVSLRFYVKQNLLILNKNESKRCRMSQKHDK